ncbi:MAG TPA: 5'-nucleosidase [Steroidobacteraceae bacterium]|jgi:adenosylhomocysteine nucleosidase|nr:5'-nucleosidase [Steroidobacteraceae bacterium]
MSELPGTLVVIALRIESAGVFEAAGVPVLYCGVGKVNAAIALTKELSRYAHQGEEMPLVVNFGSAGSRCFAPGTLVSCQEFVQRDMDVSGLGFALGVTPYDEAPSSLLFDPVFTHLPAAVCGSGDSFATADIEVDCTVIDMEAYALAKVCWHENARFACVKYVTDGADHTAAEDWQRNVHVAAYEFLQLFQGLQDSGVQ